MSSTSLTMRRLHGTPSQVLTSSGATRRTEGFTNRDCCDLLVIVSFGLILLTVYFVTFDSVHHKSTAFCSFASNPFRWASMHSRSSILPLSLPTTSLYKNAYQLLPEVWVTKGVLTGGSCTGPISPAS